MAEWFEWRVIVWFRCVAEFEVRFDSGRGVYRVSSVWGRVGGLAVNASMRCASELNCATHTQVPASLV